MMFSGVVWECATCKAMPAITALVEDRDAERLKRQQAEHERDCILEDLAAMGKERDALLTLLRDLDADEMTDYRKTFMVRVKAALAAQEKP
jgi:coenzyme F420-reducing hydrogenase beta subunit